MQQCFSQKSALIFDRINRNAPAYPVSLCRCVQKRCNMCMFTVFYYNPICAKNVNSQCEWERTGNDRPTTAPNKIAHRQSRCLWTSQRMQFPLSRGLGRMRAGVSEACGEWMLAGHAEQKSRIGKAPLLNKPKDAVLPLCGAEVPCSRSGQAKGRNFRFRAAWDE